ncbi:MAG: serine protease [Prevotellaceae bacterium]|jgi:tetratricopeptide (TPR) repeat protein|nr:serine protease [Prevotellaceae bacterium]
MKKLTLLLTLLLATQWSAAQAPKWVEKAKRAVFSVITYDADGKMLNTGNGFFVGEDGTALSDYTLFRGAQRAIAINSEGTQMPVETILGANDIYDVVKFRVAIPSKKTGALTVAAAPAPAGAQVYLLPYSTQKDRSYTAGTVQTADKIQSAYTYYTLNLPLKEKMVSCPVVNADGQVIGLAQKAMGKDTATISYAVSADFAAAQQITAVSYNDRALLDIGIPKALPDSEEQATVYLYMASSALTPQAYRELLDRFIAQYPANADGYMRSANNRLALSREPASLQQAEADMDKALDVATKKDDIYFNRAKLIYTYRLAGGDSLTYRDWNYERALREIRQAVAIDPMPIYVQFEGDVLFAMQNYPEALTCYEQVNRSNLASPETFFSAAKTKELMQSPAEEVLALMDSCIVRIPQPYTSASAPYLLERAQVRMNADQARGAMQDYDNYYKAVAGQVNDLFYYYREQAAMKSRQYQRALDDIAKAIELEPNDLTYRAEQAVINIRVARYDIAVDQLKAALAIDAGYAEAYRLMGIAQVQLKQPAAACDSFARAKELGDPNVDALIEKHCTK